MEQHLNSDNYFCPKCLSICGVRIHPEKQCACGFSIGRFISRIPVSYHDYLLVGLRDTVGNKIVNISTTDISLNKVFQGSTYNINFNNNTARLGRSDKNVNDVYVPDNSVKPKHAILVRYQNILEGKKKSEIWIIAHPDANNLWVNEEPVFASLIKPYDLIQLGNVIFYLEPPKKHVFNLRSPDRLLGGSIESPAVLTIERQLPSSRYLFKLDRKLFIHSGQLIALIGESGCGKSTLLKELAGASDEPGCTNIQITATGEKESEQDEQRSFRIGYVPQIMPQADSLQMHRALTPGQIIRYAVQLRDPALTRKEVRQRVRDTVAQMGLGENAEKPLKKLSGGQVTRVSVAMELVSAPSVLFLDEPTTGLDPGWDADIMKRFRLLSRRGPCVVLTTHNLTNLNLVDQVIILGKKTNGKDTDGFVSFIGSPQEAKKQYGNNLDRVFEGEMVPLIDPDESQDNGNSTNDQYSSGIGNKPRQRPLLLFKREGHRLRHALMDIALIIALPLVIGLLFSISLPRCERTTTLGFLSVVAMIWMGMNATAHSIVGERDILRRELRVFLKPWAYVFAKIGSATSIVIIQAIALSLAISQKNIMPYSDNWFGWPVLIMTLTVSGIVGAAFSLLISAISPTRRVASLIVVLIILFQIVPSFEVAGSGLHKTDPDDYDNGFSLSMYRNDRHSDDIRKYGTPPCEAIMASYLTASRYPDQVMRSVVLNRHAAWNSAWKDLMPLLYLLFMSILFVFLTILWLMLSDGKDIYALRTIVTQRMRLISKHSDNRVQET